jgi:hypothetical protein
VWDSALQLLVEERGLVPARAKLAVVAGEDHDTLKPSLVSHAVRWIDKHWDAPPQWHQASGSRR